MEEWSYTSTHPLGHTGPVTGKRFFNRNDFERRNGSDKKEGEPLTEIQNKM
jgi:hypothetical protein